MSPKKDKKDKGEKAGPSAVEDHSTLASNEMVPFDDLIRDPKENVRLVEHMDIGDFEKEKGLIWDIYQHGLKTPLVGHRRPDGRVLIKAGNRRMLTIEELRKRFPEMFATVPVRVFPEDTPAEILLAQLADQAYSKGLTGYEKMLAVWKAYEALPAATEAKVMEIMDLSRGVVQIAMMLKKLPKAIKEAYRLHDIDPKQKGAVKITNENIRDLYSAQLKDQSEGTHTRDELWENIVKGNLPKEKKMRTQKVVEEKLAIFRHDNPAIADTLKWVLGDDTVNLSDYSSDIGGSKAEETAAKPKKSKK